MLFLGRRQRPEDVAGMKEIRKAIREAVKTRRQFEYGINWITNCNRYEAMERMRQEYLHGKTHADTELLRRCYETSD